LPPERSGGSAGSAMTTLPAPGPVSAEVAGWLRCPRCRARVERTGEAYHCVSCGAEYPIVLGIPDFRLREDPLIPLADDYRKGETLELAAERLGFEELVRYYWSLPTHPPTPDDLKERFVRHVLTDPGRIEGFSAHLGRGSAFLEVGCGAGMLVRAAHQWFTTVVGADIGFRWLIVARRGLLEAGLPVNLICCNAEHLPLAPGRLDTVAAVSLLEHLPAPDLAIQESARVLVPGGRMFLWTANRFSLAPEPHVRVWGVGFLPRRWMPGYVRWRRGLAYEHKRLLSRGELRQILRRNGFTETRFFPPVVTDADLEQLSGLERLAAQLWRVMRRVPFLWRVISPVFPVLQVVARRKAEARAA